MPAAVTGGVTFADRQAPTVDAGAYADGDALSGLMTFDVAERPMTGAVTRIRIRSGTTVGVDSFLHLFNANPSASTVTKNAAVVIHADDRAKAFESIKLSSSDWSQRGAAGFVCEKAVWLPFVMGAGNPGKIYGVLEFDGAHTPGATDDFGFWLGGELNG